jgi:signal peptide peptidase SppA
LGLALFSEDHLWAISREHIRALVTAVSQVDIEAVSSRLAGTSIEGGGPYLKNYNGVGVINVRGPLLPYRSIFTWLLGGSAVEDITTGLMAAVNEPAIRSIVLSINSPGGQIDGINELANAIRAANAQKPVTAYVSGLGASGAYWLASAAGRIVADETAQLGSIGVLATVYDDTAAVEKHGIKRYEIVSSQSPLKRTDPSTTEGRSQLQTMVDALAQVFVEKVAAFRGTTSGRVLADFGQGSLLPARAAVNAGMADELGSLDSLVGASATDPFLMEVPGLRVVSSTRYKDTGDAEEGDDDLPDPAEEEDELEEGDDNESEEASASPAEGATNVASSEERQRIAAILNCEEARGRENLARTLALTTDHDLATAQVILGAAPTAPQSTNALEAQMSQIPNPAVGTGDGSTGDTEATEIKRILGYVPSERRKVHAR